ncbi:hypothetical protein E4U19_004207 [Claviceps sp. Clav32 group G5]|nr:hypothetical protein E4U19_004207 [Claviceps sp. Clav32 group G5]KAG6045046.1 hypothetical protein E4U39_002760 [Claviceps sp. Clav50 group G5]
MAGPIIRGIGQTMAWVVMNHSRIERIAKAGGTPGTRAAPTRAGDNDKKIGVRLDYGHIFIKDGKKYQRLELQVNKDANDPSLNEMARKDSHKVWSFAEVLIPEQPLTEEEQKQAVSQVFVDLENNIQGS